MIDDSRNASNTFWGGVVVNAGPTSYGDVIGYPDFSLDAMAITMNSNNNTMTVVITGDYFKRQGLAASFGPGDLYINKDGWNVSGAGPHYVNDTFSSSEGWNYVIHLDPNNHTGNIYKINFSDIIMTSAPSGYAYRQGQAWMGGYGELVPGTVTGSIDSTGITYVLDFTNLGLGNEFGLHWTMKCGNDIIEGLDPLAPVPEPGTIVLLGAGLVGLAGILHRRKK